MVIIYKWAIFHSCLAMLKKTRGYFWEIGEISVINHGVNAPIPSRPTCRTQQTYYINICTYSTNTRLAKISSRIRIRTCILILKPTENIAIFFRI